METYVLVHGLFSGGWIWGRTASALRNQDQQVFSPTLTGLGERSHLANRDIDLNTHIQDIVGMVEYEDLTGVILVGHDVGSTVVTGVAERVPERMERLVYLDAVVTEDRQSWLQLLSPEVSSRFLRLARVEGNGWRVPPPFPSNSRYRDHPLRPLTQPADIRDPRAAEIPRTFIRCTDRRQDHPLARIWPSIDKAAERARERGWDYRQLHTGHEPMVTAPQQLAELLVDIG
jgi:pimeloyl-ACP methyl ester carboxylesterase